MKKYFDTPYNGTGHGAHPIRYRWGVNVRRGSTEKIQDYLVSGSAGLMAMRLGAPELPQCCEDTISARLGLDVARTRLASLTILANVSF